MVLRRETVEKDHGDNCEFEPEATISATKTNLVQAKATPSNVEDDEIAENKEETAEQKKRFRRAVKQRERPENDSVQGPK